MDFVPVPGNDDLGIPGKIAQFSSKNCRFFGHFCTKNVKNDQFKVFLLNQRQSLVTPCDEINNNLFSIFLVKNLRIILQILMCV